MEDKAEDRAGADGEQAGIKSEGGGRISRGLVEGSGRDVDGSERHGRVECRKRRAG